MSERYVDSSASIASDVELGWNVYIERNVVIGEGTRIGDNVVIHKGTYIGKNCVISDGAILGKSPLKAVLSAMTEIKEFSPLVVGNGVTIGANAIIYVGTILEDRVFVGDLASIREEVTVGKKTVIGRTVVVENKVKIGSFVKIEAGVFVPQLTTIEDHCFIAPYVVMTNDNYMGRTKERFKHFAGPTVKRGARIGAGAVLLPGITIGEDAVVGAGSVVTKDVPPKIVVVGSPASYLKNVPKEQLLGAEEQKE